MSKPFDFSIDDAAAFFGVHKSTIYTWIENGCPKSARGKVDLKAVHEWWFKNVAAQKAASAGGEDSLNEAKRKFWWLRAESEEIKIQKERGLLLTKSEIEKGWAWRMSEYKSGCENLEHSLPPLLEGKNQAEMRNIIGDYVWNLFDRVCREGSFSPEKKLTKQVNKKTGPKKKAAKKKAAKKKTVKKKVAKK